jgi:hypothetical protein
MFDYDLQPVGAEYVANRERELQQAVDYINLVSQVPQFAEQVNWEAMLKMVTRKFGFKEDPETFLSSKPAMPPQQQGGMPMADPASGMMLAGGNTPMTQDPMQAAQASAMAAGGLPMVGAAQAAAAQAGSPEALLSQLMQPGQ